MIAPGAIVLLSDSTGITARKTLNRALSQFSPGPLPPPTSIHPHVSTESAVAGILHGCHEDTLVIYTLSDPTLRMQTSRMCDLSNIQHVDLMGVSAGCEGMDVLRWPLVRVFFTSPTCHMKNQ